MYRRWNIFPRVSSEDARRTTLLKEWCMCVWVQAAGHGDRGPQVAQLRGRNSNCVFQGCASPLRSAHQTLGARSSACLRHGSPCSCPRCAPWPMLGKAVVRGRTAGKDRQQRRVDGKFCSDRCCLDARSRRHRRLVALAPAWLCAAAFSLR